MQARRITSRDLGTALAPAALVPSFNHDGLVRLFRDRPDLSVALLRDVLGIEVPAHVEVRIESGDLTDIQPAARYADLVTLVLSEKPVLAIVVEVQLAIDPDKRFSWPAYVTNLRARLRCDAELLVFTPSREVAEWAAQPIRIGRGEIRPLVVGPEGVPCVTSREEAARDPELAVLSAVAHGRDAVMVAVPIADAALAALSQFPDERALLYSDLILAGLSNAARAAMEELMPGGYEYQSDFARRHQALGRAEGRAEGLAEGRAEGLAEGREQTLRDTVLRLLRARFGRLDAETETRVAEAPAASLDGLIERVVTAASVEEVFAP